jgi:DNA-binding phage protein
MISRKPSGHGPSATRIFGKRCFERLSSVLRDYVNATAGFGDLEKRTDIPAKSLMRMLGPTGNPSAANLANILSALEEAEGVSFELALKR